MTSINQLEHEEAIETFDAEPWAQQLDLQWEKRFEQREPPTEDRVIQVDLGSRDHPKSIFISENLLLMKKRRFDSSYTRVLLAQRPITLVLMMINSCSYSTNDLVYN